MVEGEHQHHVRDGIHFLLIALFSAVNDLTAIKTIKETPFTVNYLKGASKLAYGNGSSQQQQQQEEHCLVCVNT
ncbi:unnamed protein product [Ilex paraguariensis]|uniref:Uncharacterized protein n=1 Tax=Ilex paraguariensis TaxID=185542 RepID=A0ABC8SJB4_9AQUA